MAQTTFSAPSSGWRQATFTAWYPTATSTTYQEFVLPELANATEIVGYIGTSGGTALTDIHLILVGGRDVISKEYDTKLLATSNDTYNISVALKYTKSTTTLGYRQSYVGSASSFYGIVEVWYR